MANIHPKVLLVEGKEDLRVIPELIEANGITWGTKKNPIVYIRDYEGYESLIDPNIISTELQASGLTNLGIIVDADEIPDSRWQSLRNVCIQSIPDLPEDLPSQGLILDIDNNIKFGIWIMPDNRLRGMLETFLAYMIPNNNDSLWQLAQEVTQNAQQQGATFKMAHRDKANIYTWLAWQDPPGRQLHQAIQQRILNPAHPEAQRFVSWFKDLYELA